MSKNNEIDMVCQMLSGSINQVELYKTMGWESRKGSRVGRRLESAGLIVRRRVRCGTRWTYALELAPGVAVDNIHRFLVANPVSHIEEDYVAPDISPKVRQAVDLRLAGLKIKDIASKLHVNDLTVHKYLGYARHPEKVMIDRERMLTRMAVKEDADVDTLAAKLTRVVHEEGYLFSDDTRFACPLFRKAARLLHYSDRARLAELGSKVGIIGPLANKAVLYVDRRRVAKEIARRGWRFMMRDFLDQEGRVGRADYLRAWNYLKTHRGTLSGKLTEAFVGDDETRRLIKAELDALSSEIMLHLWDGRNE